MLVVCLYFCPLQKIWKVQKCLKQLPKVHPSSSVISPDPSLCLSVLLQKHSLTEFLLWAWAWACTRHRGYSPCPCPCPWQCPVCGIGIGPEVERPPRMGSYLDCQFSPEDKLLRASFCKEFGTKKWNDSIYSDFGKEKVGNDDAKHTEQSG